MPDLLQVGDFTEIMQACLDTKFTIYRRSDFELPNIEPLPHIGSGTVESRATVGDLTVDNLLQHTRDGTAINV